MADDIKLEYRCGFHSITSRVNNFNFTQPKLHKSHVQILKKKFPNYQGKFVPTLGWVVTSASYNGRLKPLNITWLSCRQNGMPFQALCILYNSTFCVPSWCQMLQYKSRLFKGNLNMRLVSFRKKITSKLWLRHFIKQIKM